jgi:hypothetical protein
MIACVRAPGRFGHGGVRSSVTGRRRLQLMHPARAVPGVWLPWIYKSKERGRGALYLNT